MSTWPRIFAFFLIAVSCGRGAEALTKLNPTAVSIVGDSANAAQVLEEVENVARRWRVQPPGNSTETLLTFVVVSQPALGGTSYCLSGTIRKLDASGVHTGGTVTIKREERISRGDILRNVPPEVRRSEQSHTLSAHQAAVIYQCFMMAGFLDPKTRPAVGTELFDGNPLYVETVKDGQKLGFARNPDSTDPFFLEISRFELWTRAP